MASEPRPLKGLTRVLGFLSGTILLSALVCTGPASAQCGPTGPVSAKNTACGTTALSRVTTGTRDSAFGYNALGSTTTGFRNTAIGNQALNFNTTGSENTASGAGALFFNTTGFDNTASGIQALNHNTTGDFNTASGDFALWSNTTGFDNTASGDDALESNTTGHNNIGIGEFAGDNIATGSNNIDIANDGFNESSTIRIGTAGTQTKTYIAGISTASVIGNVVEVNSNGQLGIAMSSARYKRDIRNLGNASAGLMKLRPVTFRYKEDPSGALEYGLVAEEVQRVYPNLVTYGADGKLQSVRYLEFTALLLNELQKQDKNSQKQTDQLKKQTQLTRELTQRLEIKDQQVTMLQHEVDALKQKDARIDVLSERLAALERQGQTASSQGLRSLASK